MLTSSNVSVVLLVLLGVLLAESDWVNAGRSRKRTDRADHGESSEDYDDSPGSYEEDDNSKDKRITSKSYYAGEKSKKSSKDFFKGFNPKDFDSAEFASIPDPPASRKSSFDWDDDDFPDFKDFREDLGESPTTGFKSHVSLQAGFPSGPYNHEYSITHPRSPNKKSFDFDDLDFNSKEENEGAYSSPDSTRYGPLLTNKKHPRYRLSSEATNNVPKKVKFDPEDVMGNNTSCFKTRKRMKDSNKDSKKYMVCYVCYDDDNEKSFERCSYESQPQESVFSYESRSKSQKGDGSRKRSKREVVVKTKREVFPDDSGEFGFGDFNADSAEFYDPEFDDAEDPNRRHSGDKPSFSGSSSGRSCLRTKKNNMICVRCMDGPNGLSEECSYESDPVENSYEYSAKKSFGSDPEINYPDRFKRSLINSKERKTEAPKDRLKRSPEPKRRRMKVTNTTDVGKDLNATSPININSSIQAPTLKPLARPPVQQIPKNRIQSVTDIYNNHFLRLFPELKEDERNVEFEVARAINAMTDRDDSDEASVFVFEDSGEDIIINPERYDGVIGEFLKRDWSNCTLNLRENLTCYMCNDNGTKHEECLSVSLQDIPKQNQEFNYKRNYLNKNSPKKFVSDKPEPNEIRRRRIRSISDSSGAIRRQDYSSDFHYEPSSYSGPSYSSQYSGPPYSGSHFSSSHYEHEPFFESHSDGFNSDDEEPDF